MLDALQVWLPDPSQPLSPLIAGLAAGLTILIFGGAMSALGREPADLVTEGAVPLQPFIDAGPVRFQANLDSAPRVQGSPYPRTAVSMALSAIGGTTQDSARVESPPGCVRTEFKVRMPYGRDFTRTMAVILEGCRACEGVLDEPAPKVSVAGLADSAIELIARAWSSVDDSEVVAESLRRAIQGRLAEAGLDMPVEDVDEARLTARHQRS